MSNVFKHIFMGQDEFDPNQREIDYNGLADERIVEFKEKDKKRKTVKKPVNPTEGPMDADGVPEGELSEEELAGLFGEQPSAEEIEEANNQAVAQSEEILADANAKAEQILADANAQAESILADAESAASSMKSQALEEGKKEGFDMGMAMASSEVDNIRAEFDQKELQRQEEYKQSVVEMEHELIDTVCDIISKVFTIQFEDKQEIILHLCENAISNIESSREFQIKVNDKSYEFLQSNKSAIIEKVGSDIQLDIILDPLLDDGQCIIETDGGVFDCSLGVQLSNLIKDIKSLS